MKHTAKVCVTCGAKLGTKNGIRVGEAFSADGMYMECRACAGKRFAHLKRVTGSGTAALYAMCAAMDIPFDAKWKPDKKYAESKTEKVLLAIWNAYLDAHAFGTGFKWSKDIPEDVKTFVTAAGKNAETDEGGQERTGTDGSEQDHAPADTDGAEETASEADEKDRMKAWVKKWGPGMTPEDYMELDRKYDVESHEFKGNITPRIDKNLIALSKLDVEFDKAMQRADFDTANRITDIIRKTRDMESLRASDEKPAEEMRVDAIVNALESRGAMTDGTLCDRETLLRWVFDAVHAEYSTSLDIIDAIMLIAENARRRTEGERVMTSVPVYLQVKDKYGELSEHMTPQETETMQALGKMPPRRDK